MYHVDSYMQLVSPAVINLVVIHNDHLIIVIILIMIAAIWQLVCVPTNIFSVNNVTTQHQLNSVYENSRVYCLTLCKAPQRLILVISEK